MAAVSAGVTSPFDLRSASLTLLAMLLKTTDLQRLAAELEQRQAETPELFNQEPVLVDLAAVREHGTPLDMEALVALLRRYRLLPVAARGGNPLQMEAAIAAGLADSPDALPQNPRAETVREIVREVVREVPVPANSTSMLVDKPLRSGQQVYSRGGDLVVLAQVNCGAEVIADGSVHVYAPLRGKVVAGARGNTAARIFTTCLEPELISIAGTYRTAENPLPADVRGKPAMVRLEGEKLVIEPIKI